MKNNVTELVFILDRSGSMAGLVSDTIGGFNSLIDKQKKKAGECYVTTVLFDTRFDTLHDRVRLSDVRPMTEEEYTPGGCTALLDAVGDTIRHIVNIHRYARPEDVPENTVFVITTDGMENASRRYTYSKLKELIERQKEKYGWEFLFLGANIDSAREAGRFGIGRDNCADYLPDSQGTEVIYGAVCEAVSSFRASRPLAAHWKKSIDNDVKSRKR